MSDSLELVSRPDDTGSIPVSRQLFEHAQFYLDLADRGVMTEERASAHDQLMRMMQDEGIPFLNREHARALARRFIVYAPTPSQPHGGPDVALPQVRALLCRGWKLTVESRDVMVSVIRWQPPQAEASPIELECMTFLIGPELERSAEIIWIRTHP